VCNMSQQRHLSIRQERASSKREKEEERMILVCCLKLHFKINTDIQILEDPIEGGSLFIWECDMMMILTFTWRTAS
jgi:hypothetical protein